MLNLQIHSNESLLVDQVLRTPSVYLDHWALLDISKDPALKARLGDALCKKGGTLVLSWVNLMEFSKITDLAQVALAEALIEDVLPNIFFLEANPFTVIEKENALLLGGQIEAPHADNDFLKAFILSQQSVKLFSVQDIFVEASKWGSNQFDELCDVIVDRVEVLRGAMDSDADFEKHIKSLPPGPAIQRGTRHVLRELVRVLLIDRYVKMTKNHAADLYHAVVPIAYCDFVLLDKHWEAQIEKVRLRFESTKVSVPLSRTYSRKENGLSRFLTDLESGVVELER